MKFFNKRYTAAIAGCLFALISAGCGGGATGTGSATLVGSAGDGPLVGSTVTVVDANGTTIGTATTDASARYSISIPANAALPLTVTVTGGIDQVTGAAPDFPLKTAVTTALSTVTNTNANANPLTTIAVESAIALGGLNTTNLNAAVANVRNTLGFGLDSTFDPIGTVVSATNVAAAVKANEAVAELIRRSTASSGNTIAQVVTALAEDLTDGAVDGQVKAGVTASATTTASIAAQIQTNVVEVSAETISNALAITDTAGAIVVTAAASLAKLESSATLSNGGAAPTTLVADIPVSDVFIQQAQAAVSAAISLATTTGGTTTELTKFQTDLGGLTAGTAASAITLTASVTAMATETATTATAAQNATAGQLSAANAAVTTALNFKLNANTLTVQDYNAAGNALATFNVAGTTTSGAMTANFGANTLNSGNLSNLAQATPTGTAPKITFTLANVPTGSGTTTVIALLKDGTSAPRLANERMVEVVFDVDWTSNGTTLTLTAAAGSATATYYTAAGTAAATATLTNAAANVLSTGTSVSAPVGATQINAAISNLFNSAGLGTALNAVTVAGSYYYQIDLTGFPLIDANNASVSTLKGTFTVL